MKFQVQYKDVLMNFELFRQMIVPERMETAEDHILKPEQRFLGNFSIPFVFFRLSIQWLESIDFLWILWTDKLMGLESYFLNTYVLFLTSTFMSSALSLQVGSSPFDCTSTFFL